MLQTDQEIDRYVVESVIGSGGTAVVYRVRHKHLDTWHALKVLSVTSPSIRERMIREGQVQAKLRHLNIVAVTDVLDVEGSPGLLMEYIEGPSLERALQQYRLDLQAAEILFLGILSGVRHAHHHGLVHRDLKPANVLLARTPDGFVPKVTDFGLAKVLEGEGQATGQTRSGVAMGTPAYMAPEQIRDARTVDQRADVFSLGCILYELATRHRAFPGDDALAIYNAITGGTFVPPREVQADLPDRVDLAIRGALAIRREERIPDADVLLRVLRGEQGWDPPAPALTEEVPRPGPEPVSPSDAPEMQIAARGPGGATPGGAPQRVSSPSMGLRSVGDPLESPPSRPSHPPASLDGTLNGEDASDPGTGVGNGPTSAVTWLLAAVVAFVVGLGVLIAVGGIAATMWVGNRPPAATAAAPKVEAAQAEPVDALPVAADVADPEPGTAAAPAPAPAAAAPRPAPAKAAPAQPAPAKASPRTTTPRTPAPQPSAPAASTTPPPAAALVTTKILSVPPTATVRVDGRELGRTPLKVELPAGKHQVVLSSAGAEARFQITVRSEGDNRWCHDFGGTETFEGSCPR